MNEFIKKIGLLLGMHITRVTSVEELDRLIKSLYPVITGSKLIRIGPKSDGGYLLPDDLEGIEALFSPGVGEISLFENDCAKYGMKVFLADKSVDGPSLENELFVFDKKFVGATDTEDFITLDTWVNKSGVGTKSDLLLQMDIEGYEYESILNISTKLMNRFRIIVIEFHDLNLLLSKPFFDKFSNVFNKILQTHECVHIHPNNCCKIIKYEEIEIPPVMEFTFIRKDRISEKKFSIEFPHKLDSDTANEKPISLPKCWYGN